LTENYGSSQEREACKSPREEAGAPVPAPASLLKRPTAPVDKQFKILGFNLLNTYSKMLWQLRGGGLQNIFKTFRIKLRLMV